MSFFKKKQSKASKQRLQLELFHSESGDTRLAFGLQWTTIVTTGGQGAASAIARKSGATHMLYKGQQIGYGIIDPKLNPDLAQARVYAAAQVAANQYGGNAVFIVKLNEAEYWLAVIRNGQPTTVDQFIRAESDALVAQQAERHISAAAEDEVSLTVYTNLQHHDFSTPRIITLAELMAAAEVGDDPMMLIPASNGLNLPKPVMFAIIAACVVLLLQQLWSYREQRAKEAERIAALKNTDEPAAVAWARVVGNWEKSIPAPSSAGFLSARETIGSAPLLWDGWMLKDAVCTAGQITTGAPSLPNLTVVAPNPAETANGELSAQDRTITPANSSSRTWSCSANYERSQAGNFNKQLVTTTPKDWKIKFLPLNKLVATWSVVQPNPPIQLNELPNVDTHMLETVSKLQELSPSFTGEVTLAFVPAPIPAPKKSDGKDYPPDPVATSIQTAPISVKGPLRTMDALSQAGIQAVWTKISINTQSLSQINIAQSSLAKSAINAEVNGVIYAKNK